MPKKIKHERDLRINPANGKRRRNELQQAAQELGVKHPEVIAAAGAAAAIGPNTIGEAITGERKDNTLARRATTGLPFAIELREMHFPAIQALYAKTLEKLHEDLGDKDAWVRFRVREQVMRILTLGDPQAKASDMEQQSGPGGPGTTIVEAMAMYRRIEGEFKP